MAKKAGKRGNGEGCIYERSKGKWASVITIGTDPLTGKQIRKFVYGNSRGEVVEKLRELQNQLAAGGTIDASKTTLGEWINTWLEYYMKPSIRPTTYENYRRQLDVHIIPNLGHIQLKKLNTTHIQAFYKKLSETGNRSKVKGDDGEMVLKGGGLAPASITRIHNILRSALEQAKTERKIPANPVLVAKPPKVDRVEMKTLSTEQIGHFLNQSTEYRYYPSYHLALSTGMRRGEVLGAAWSNINVTNAGEVTQNRKNADSWDELDKRLPWSEIQDIKLWDTDALSKLLEPIGLLHAEININQQLVLIKDGTDITAPKTLLSNRTIDLPYDTLMVLIFQRYLQRKERAEYEAIHGKGTYNKFGLVFCTCNGNPVPPRSYTRNFQMALKHADLDPTMRFHDLRHSVATYLLEEKTPLNTVADLLGHYAPSFTATQYGHVTRRMKDEATHTVSEVLKSAKSKN